MRSLAAALVAALALAGCGHSRKKLPPPAPIPVERPLIGLQAAKVESLGFTGLDLQFACAVENPNPFPLSVAGVRYGLAIEGRPAASGANPTPLAVPPAVAGVPGRASFLLPVALRWSSVPSFAPLLALDREAAYALTGEVTFSTPGGLVGVPLSRTGTLSVPKAPRFKVGRARVRATSPLEIVVEVAVGVENPNAFDIPAGRLRYGFFLTDREVARTDVAIPEPIGAGARTEVAVPLKISTVKAGKAAARLMLPFASLDAAVRGEAVFGGVPVPLDLAASLLPRE